MENVKLKSRFTGDLRPFQFSILHFTFTRLLVLGLAGILVTACWPSRIGFRDDSMPAEWKVFFVEPLELNAATAPANYSAVLTESLRSGIQNNTRLKTGSDPDKAEVQITGTIISYSTSPQALTEGDNAARSRLTISANFTIITPTQGLEKMTVTSTRFADYDANQNLSDVENDLIEEINRLIVQDVINKLLSNW